MTFIEFCRLHGVMLLREPPPGRWVRVPTDDKPHHKNGAVKLMGHIGFVQNWATMTEPATWHAEGLAKNGTQRTQKIANQAAQEARVNAQKAAQRAMALLADCELAPHPYLASKGFRDEMVNVWNRKTDNLMVVPMRIGRTVVGAQLITPDGEKKFLYGQRSGGAEFIFGAGRTHFLCEGYATALSARVALTNLKVAYTLHVCFSAASMKRVAEGLESGFVLADNDHPSKNAPQPGGMGRKVANEIGWPFWISDQMGEDCNDFWLRRGVFALAMGIKKVMAEATRRRA